MMRVSVDLNRKCYPWTSTQQHTTYAHACQQVYLEGQQLELWREAEAAGVVAMVVLLRQLFSFIFCGSHVR